jgi:mono/diheme cytochrome c family protein
MSLINSGASVLAAALCLTAGLTAARAPAQTLAPPTYTEAQAKRGQDVYQRNCRSCHGDQLDNGSFGAPLAGAVFLQRWGGKALDEPFTIMTATMPPDTPGALGAAAYADVMAFILKENGTAPSATELPFDIAKLKAMAAPK